MSIALYEIKSPLSQVSDAQANTYLAGLEAALVESFEKLPIDAFAAADFGLVYIASGGSEGLFRQIYTHIQQKPCYLLTSGDSNSLAASMEILSYLQQQGRKGEILHGESTVLAARIRTLAAAARAKTVLTGLRLGVVGAPSDWLIASGYSKKAYGDKLGAEVISIPMEELIDAAKQNPILENRWTEQLRALAYPKPEMDKALSLYAALHTLVDRYQLDAVTVRCFDLLNTVHTTGCLALAILNAEGIYAGCEGDVPSAVSMAILGAVSGQPVFMCNPSRIDPEKETMVLAHCTLPVRMPYEMTLTTHYESGIGVAIAGSIPEGSCTVFKASGDLARYYAEAGTIARNLREPTLCRSQIEVALPDFSYFLRSPISNHHLVCTGDHVAALREFFAMLG